MVDLDGSPANLINPKDFAGQFCHLTRGADWDKVALKSEKVKTLADPGLDPSSAVVVEPDAHLLRLQLLLLSQVAHDHHHAPGLQDSESKFAWH